MTGFVIIFHGLLESSMVFPWNDGLDHKMGHPCIEPMQYISNHL